MGASTGSCHGLPARGLVEPGWAAQEQVRRTVRSCKGGWAQILQGPVRHLGSILRQESSMAAVERKAVLWKRNLALGTERKGGMRVDMLPAGSSYAAMPGGRPLRSVGTHLPDSGRDPWCSGLSDPHGRGCPAVTQSWGGGGPSSCILLHTWGSGKARHLPRLPVTTLPQLSDWLWGVSLRFRKVGFSPEASYI